MGVKIITPVEELSRAGIVTYTLGTYEANKRAYNAFKEAGIAVSHRYIGGVGGIRISPHFFNREEDIDEALITQKWLIDSCFGNSGRFRNILMCKRKCACHFSSEKSKNLIPNLLWVRTHLICNCLILTST